MPSPFPGMDPWLEAPAIWPDLHDALASQIRAELNQVLPTGYYARLEMRPEVGIGEDDSGIRHRIVPDVSVVRPARVEEGGVATESPPRSRVSPSHHVRVLNEEIQHSFVEIRDANAGHRLVTLIEIASPSNKRAGPDHRAYKAKQEEVLGSNANLIEIDLLRGGLRLFASVRLAAYFDELSPRPDYVVTVCRWWERENRDTGYQLFAWTLREPLPCIGVPLKQGEAEVPLDLQHAFSLCYDGGPYRRGAVDYSKPPEPPLRADDAAWADERLRLRHAGLGAIPGMSCG